MVQLFERRTAAGALLADVLHPCVVEQDLALCLLLVLVPILTLSLVLSLVLEALHFLLPAHGFGAVGSHRRLMMIVIIGWEEGEKLLALREVGVLCSTLAKVNGISRQ